MSNDVLHDQQTTTSRDADHTQTFSKRYTRRTILKGAAAGAAALGGSFAFGAGPYVLGAPTSGLPSPAQSGIEHFVFVTMENRSFDHFLGWLPHANGKQAGLLYPNPNGSSSYTYPLAPDYQGCGHPDPDHSYQGGRIQYDGGKADGWLLDTANDIYSIGYYTQGDLAFLGQAAPGWSTCDNYFAAILGPTYPNRIYTHAGQTDRITNTTTISTLPTIWDRLAASGLSGRYYYSDVPFLALWGSKYLPISRPFASFLTDCAADTLPQVSYIDPRFTDEDSGTSADDHPHADIRNGEAFLNSIYQAVTTSPAWSKTVLVITYDEWGGFFDHVAPTTAPISPATKAAGDTDGRRGFRVPCLIISPWSRRGAVPRTLYDHTSVLRMIEWRWGLQPLTVRDATANNLAASLNFSAPSLTAPRYAVPTGPFGAPCPIGSSTSSAEAAEWAALTTLAQSYGWPIY
ncbi:MAG TPA: alkaline phosphatase family protein [Ktedonobacterales bacterium]